MPSPSSSIAPIHGAVQLADWGVIRATGADAAAFLQGQLTQDVASLDGAHSRLAGYCSAKGRLMASFVVWRPQPDQFLMACSADLLAAVLKRLSMFVLRARCRLEDVSSSLPLTGLVGDTAEATDRSMEPGDCAAIDAGDEAASRPATHLIRLPDSLLEAGRIRRWLCCGPVTPQRVRSLSLADWNGLEALSGVARIQACTMEQFVPQMVNFDLTGGVSFQKGCYPGQEVVARSQYRGTIKRRSHTYASAEALTPGQGVFDAEDPDQPAGQVVLAGHWPGAGPAPAHAGVALVEVKLAALASGRLHAGRPDGPLLTALELPYSLPQDAH